MSKDLNEIVLFAKVVEIGGFREAARALEVRKMWNRFSTGTLC